VPVSAAVTALVVAGTWVVYSVDRLRDVERDRATSPRRTAFIERHAPALKVVTGAAALLAAGLAFRVGPGAALVLTPAAVLGFWHRRVKHLAILKSSYLTLAWLCVVVAFPAVASGGARHVGWAALVLGAAIQANSIASNVRDHEAAVPRVGAGPALGLSRMAAASGMALAFLAPPGVRSLGFVPAATLLALLRFRPDEHYGLVVVDGALLAGALAALAAYGAG